MPQLDYMILAEYVRTEPVSGAVHIMCAGFDTIAVPSVPAAQSLHVVIRITFGSEERPGTKHALKLVFTGADRTLATAGATLEVPPPKPDTPIHWRTGLLMNLAMALPLPAYGDYGLELVIDEVEQGGTNLRVIPAPEGART